MSISQKLREYFKVPSTELDRMLLDLEDCENHYNQVIEQAWKVAAKFKPGEDADVERLKDLMDV